MPGFGDAYEETHAPHVRGPETATSITGSTTVRGVGVVFANITAVTAQLQAARLHPSGLSAPALRRLGTEKGS